MFSLKQSMDDFCQNEAGQVGSRPPKAGLTIILVVISDTRNFYRIEWCVNDAIIYNNRLTLVTPKGSTLHLYRR